MSQPEKSVGPSHDEHDAVDVSALPEPARVGRGKGALLIGGAVVLVVIAFGAGLLPKVLRKRALDDDSEAAAKAAPRVEIVTPKPITSDRALDLPGTIVPLEETVIYPRIAGYVRRWTVDIGDQVKEGQLLVEIETPELDAQIEQARADLAQAEASKLRAETNADLSATERKRYEVLTPAGVTSNQELAQRQAQAKVDEANIKVSSATVASQQANLRRLLQSKGFARVTAPFAGTIIARSVERGSLVAAGNGTPMFRLAASDPVRVFIQVPQDVAPNIASGVKAVINVREYGNRKFEGQVARSANALDATSRTMTTEIRVPNPKHELLPGMYVRVAITLPTPHRLFELPATALFSGAAGTQVAVLDGQNRVAMRKIEIERDTGATLEVATGLDGSERVVRIANAALVPGSTVEILAPAAADPSSNKK